MQLERFDYHTLIEAGALGSGKRSFLPPDLRAPMVDPAAPPLITEADVEAARKEGAQQGYLQGMEDGQRQAQSEQDERNQRVLALADALKQQIDAAFMEHHEYLSRQKADLPKLVYFAAKKVAGDVLAESALQAVVPVVQKSLELVTGQFHMTIRVHPDHAAALESQLLQKFLGNHDASEIVIEADPALALSDCHVQWHNGHAERSEADLWKQIEEILTSWQPPAAQPPSNQGA